MIDQTIIPRLSDALASLQRFRAEADTRGIDLGFNASKIRRIEEAIESIVGELEGDTTAVLKNIDFAGLIEDVVLARFYLQRFLQILKKRSLLRRLGKGARQQIQATIDVLAHQAGLLCAIEEGIDSLFEKMTYGYLKTEPYGERHYEKACDKIDDVLFRVSDLVDLVESHQKLREIDREEVVLRLHLVEVHDTMLERGCELTRLRTDDGGRVETVLEKPKVRPSDNDTLDHDSLIF